MIVQNNKAGRARAIEEIARGNIVAYRTDTFYGLGVNPFNADALRKLSSLKPREQKPVLVVVSEVSQVERFFARRTKLFEALSARFWPGALTIVERARAHLSSELTASTNTIGVRLPDDEVVQEFVRLCGGALTATSANTSGETPARTAAEAARYFPSIMVLDGGEAQSDKPSSVLDISNATYARLVREGVLTFNELQKALRGVGVELLTNDQAATPKHHG